MLWFVSRQSYWPDGDLVVEIAMGGQDYSNPDTLCEKYGKEGEWLETSDPREALEAAIAVRNAWNADLDEGQARIETGYTMGMTMPFESHPSDDDLREWAEEAWEETPKCDQCGEPLSDQGDNWVLLDWDELVFCSENCSEAFYWDNTEVSEDD